MATTIAENPQAIIEDQETVPSIGYDRALGTQIICIFGVMTTSGLAIAAVALAATFIRRPNFEYAKSLNNAEGILTVSAPLSLARAAPYLPILGLTICTEILGYIHSVSLRWALIHEGRGEFNSTLRLLTAAKSSRGNTWQVNLLYAVLLIVNYTAMGQVFEQWDTDVNINSVALLMLGISLLGLCAIAALTMYDGRETILSWSANPLNTTLACLHHGIIQRRHVRNSNVSARVFQNAGSSPLERHFPNVPLKDASPRVLRTARFQCVVFVLSILLMCISYAIVYTRNGQKKSIHLSFFPSFYYSEDATAHFYIGKASWPFQARIFCVLLFSAVLQSFLTFALHVTEMLVNMHRDEDTWREASSDRGARIISTALLDGLRSFTWLLLFAFKPLSQWLYGVGIAIDIGDEAGITFSPLPLSALTGASLFLVLFNRMMAYGQRTRLDPQPTTYGHLQTLADLIDDWGESGEPFRWGQAEYDAAKRARSNDAAMGAMNSGAQYDGSPRRIW